MLAGDSTQLTKLVSPHAMSVRKRGHGPLAPRLSPHPHRRQPLRPHLKRIADAKSQRDASTSSSQRDTVRGAAQQRQRRGRGRQQPDSSSTTTTTSSSSSSTLILPVLLGFYSSPTVRTRAQPAVARTRAHAWPQITQVRCLTVPGSTTPGFGQVSVGFHARFALAEYDGSGSFRRYLPTLPQRPSLRDVLFFNPPSAKAPRPGMQDLAVPGSGVFVRASRDADGEPYFWVPGSGKSTRMPPPHALELPAVEGVEGALASAAGDADGTEQEYAEEQAVAAAVQAMSRDPEEMGTAAQLYMSHAMVFERSLASSRGTWQLLHAF